MNMKYLLIVLLLASCKTEKQVPNYRVTPHGIEVWHYTKIGEPKKDILTTGDTLVSTNDTLYIIHKQ